VSPVTPPTGWDVVSGHVVARARRPTTGRGRTVAVASREW
jgi:hypothetical protein